MNTKTKTNARRATAMKTTTAESLLIRARRAAAGDQLDAIDSGKQQIRDRIKAILKADGPTSVDAIGVCTEDLVSALVSGEPLPADLRDQIDAEYEAKASRDREYLVLQAAEQALVTARESVEADATDKALQYLDGVLQEILKEVISLREPLAEVYDDRSAIKSANKEAIDAWRRLGALGDQYTEIRNTQRTLLGAGGMDVQNIAQAGTTKIPVDTRYQLATGQIQIVGSMHSGSGGRFSPEPWPGFPSEGDGVGLVPTDKIPAYLQWLADRGDAWVPTTSQLKDALATRTKAVTFRVKVEDISSNPMFDDPANLRHLSRLINGNHAPGSGIAEATAS